VRHIVALRGDPPEPGAKYQPHPGGYRQCRRAGRRPQAGRAVRHFGRRLSRGPSGQRSPARRPRQSQAQVDAGADRAITQFFFSADCFFRFRDEVAAAGIDVEIVPGHPAGVQRRQTRRFAGQCGAAIPTGWTLFEGLDDLPAARQLIAATVAAELCGQLYAGGVRHFHFYTLNRAELSYAICHLLGVRAS
jgi:methylenetetrahydrofolate reductase (NADPH)